MRSMHAAMKVRRRRQRLQMALNEMENCRKLIKAVIDSNEMDDDTSKALARSWDQLAVTLSQH